MTASARPHSIVALPTQVKTHSYGGSGLKTDTQPAREGCISKTTSRATQGYLRLAPSQRQSHRRHPRQHSELPCIQRSRHLIASQTQQLLKLKVVGIGLSDNLDLSRQVQMSHTATSGDSPGSM